MVNSTTAIPETDTTVFKVGRSTTYIAGYYSSLKDARISQVSNAAGVLVMKATLEHSVTGMSGKHFSDLGDSGAMVFQGSGALVGMLCDGCIEHPISYISLAEDLFDDIKRVTGATDVRVAD